MSDDPFFKIQGYHHNENAGVFSATNFAVMMLSPASFGEISARLSLAGYGHLTKHEHINMNGIRLEQDTHIPAPFVSIIAQIAHEVNKAYCHAIGDHSQLSWDQAPDWQKESAIKGVNFYLENAGDPLFGPHRSHESWLKEKAETGWKYGPIKDPEAKTHPCFLPYGELPESQRVKDHLFIAVCRNLYKHLYQIRYFPL
jgi:hypothetical protein